MENQKHDPFTVEGLAERSRAIPDAELLERCDRWVSRLCDTGGRAWSLRVPPDPKEDPDMLFTELSRRYKALIGKEVKDV